MAVSTAGCDFKASTVSVASDAHRNQINTQERDNVKTLGGHVSISNLPPHRGLIVSLALFEADGPDSDPPYDGDPPAEAAPDCPERYNSVDLDSESVDNSREIPFAIEHSAGHFYIQIWTILFRKHNGRILAQAEQFFFGRGPLPLLDDLPSVTMPVDWPSIPIEDLEHYDTIEPQGR